MSAQTITSLPGQSSKLGTARTGMTWVTVIVMVLLALNGMRGLRGNALQLIPAKDVSSQVQPQYWRPSPTPAVVKPGKG